MKIITAEHAGMCFGVKRAVQLAENNLNSDRITCLGPLIHNKQEIQRLEKLGLQTVEEYNTAVGTKKVLIRSHGVGPQIYKGLQEKGYEIVDATCPYVQRAQQAASEANKDGFHVVILGDEEHAEVKALCSWAGDNALVVATWQDLTGTEIPGKVFLLAQTTEREERFNALENYLSDRVTELKVLNTICSATQLRQKAAAQLAQNVELMVIIGGRHSSNTNKLAEVCRQYQNNSYLIEKADEVNPCWFIGKKTVGVTAGASTPDWIIKEVIEKMEEIMKEQEQQEMFSMAGEEEAKASANEAFDKLEAAFAKGDVLEAKVIEIVKGGLLVDVGVRGFVPASHLELSYVEDLNQYLDKVLRLKVIEIDKETSRAVLSQKIVLQEEQNKMNEELWQKISEGQIKKGIVRRLTNFGAFVDIGGIDGLLHVSEMSWERVEDPTTVVQEGDEIEVYVLKVDREKQKISLSLKHLMESPWDKVKDKYQVNMAVEGKVIRIVPFGAFIELEQGIEGLAHISQLSTKRVSKVEEVLSVGDVVKVKIIDFDPIKKKLSLSLKDVEMDAEKAEYRAYLDKQNDNLKVTLGDLFKGKLK